MGNCSTKAAADDPDIKISYDPPKDAVGASASSPNIPSKSHENPHEEDQVIGLPATPITSCGNSDGMALSPHPVQKKNSRHGRRVSVSAECGNGNTSGAKRALVTYPKTQEQEVRLKQAMSASFIFKDLDEEQSRNILAAMREVHVQAGAEVISQYDDGDNFYVIESGKYDVLKKQGAKSDPGEYAKVFNYDEKGGFGELALLYNCPRAATIRAVTAGVLWAVDRLTFKQIVIEHTARKRQRYEDFLEKVPILDNITEGERSQIADILESKRYQDGEFIIRQGDTGQEFYIIEQGACKATQVQDGGEGAEVTVGEMKQGQYFGERAMLKNEARAANVVAVGEVLVVTIERETFERLLGPCKEIMDRYMEDYRTAEQVILSISQAPEND